MKHPSLLGPKGSRRRVRWTIVADDAVFDIEKDGQTVARGKTKMSAISWVQTRFNDGDSVVLKDLDGSEQIITRRVARR